MINLLLIGGGWIAETVYVPFLSSFAQVNNIYMLDINCDAVTHRFIKYAKVKVIAQIELPHLQYDIVIILTPNYLHCENLCLFLDSGKKILVEKPICTKLEEVEKIKNLMQDSKSLVSVSAPLRYRNDMRLIKEIISSGELGNIYHTEMTWLKRRGTPGTEWFTKKKFSGGGVLIDMGPHLLDLFYWFVGSKNPKKYLSSMSSFFLEKHDAYASWHRKENNVQESDVEDSSFSLFTFKDMSLNLNLAWASNVQNDFAQIKIFGSKGTLDVLTALGFSTDVLFQETKLSVNTSSKSEIKTIEIEDRKEPFRKMLLDYIQGESFDLPDAELALNVVANIVNLYRFSETTGTIYA